MKEDYQKALKRLTLFFLPNPVPFNRRSYQKQKRPGTRGQSPFKLWNQFRKILSLVIYYQTKFNDVIQSIFWVFPKITSANLCKPVHDVINCSTSIWPSVSGRWGKEGRKLQNFEYLKNEKSFLDEIRNTFHSFWRTIIW